MRKLRLVALLMGTLFVQMLQTLHASPVARTSKPIIIAPNRSSQIPLFTKPIPLMTDALNYAKTGRIGSGAKAAIYATVLLADPNSQVIPGAQVVYYANGVMRLQGDSTLVGDLAIYDNTGGGNPFRRRPGSLKLVVRANGSAQITLTRRYTTRVSTTQKASFAPTGTDGMLWGSADFAGKTRMVSIGLTKGIDPLPKTPVVEAPPIQAPAEPAKPRGMRVRVTPVFRIMNSDDGTGFFKKDMTIEVYGYLSLNQQQVWRRSFNNEMSSTKGNSIICQAIETDVFFDNPDSWRVKISGSLEDSDKPSIDSDVLWKNTVEVDVKKAIEQENGVVTLNGSKDDEYANLTLTVEKLSDIS